MKQEIIIFNNIKTPISYYIGVSKSDNFKILDYVKETDIWFHIFECTSCHVVVRLPEKEEEFLTKKQVMTIIKKGALLCRQNTNSVKKEKLVKVIYTQVKNITKLQKEGSVEANNTKIYTLTD